MADNKHTAVCHPLDHLSPNSQRSDLSIEVLHELVLKWAAKLQDNKVESSKKYHVFKEYGEKSKS